MTLIAPTTTTPPYYTKAKDLYLNYFKHQDHQNIATTIKKINKKYWLLSYDHHHAIKSLYQTYQQHSYKLSYTAQKKKVGHELLIVDGRVQVPVDRITLNGFQ